MKKSKQWKIQLVKGPVLIVGVDIARFKHVALLRTGGAEETKTIWFENNLGGFEALAKECRAFCENHGLKRMVLGLEPTGHYWEALAYWWEEKMGRVVLINPMHTKRAKEMEDNSPLKSDLKDARVVAGLVAEGKYLECHLPRGVFADLRNLVGQRERCEKQRTQLICQLNQTVDRMFPELVGAFSKLTVKSCLRLLERYSCPQELAEAPLEEVTMLLCSTSRGRLGKSRAEQVRELARNTVGVKESAPVIALEVKRLLSQLEVIEQQRDQLEEEIGEHLKQAPGANVLLTVRGFGRMTVAGILANTGNLADYQHPDEVIKLAGLNLFEISSGKRKGRLHISKRGRAQLRKILYMAALRVVQFNAPFQEYYQGLVRRGVKRIPALVAVMRKILRVIWRMVGNDEAFDPERLKAKQPLSKAA